MSATVVHQYDTTDAYGLRRLIRLVLRGEVCEVYASAPWRDGWTEPCHQATHTENGAKIFARIAKEITGEGYGYFRFKGQLIN